MTLAPSQLTDFKDFIGDLAAAAAQVIRPYFGQVSLPVEQKSDQTPVTAADREAELRLRSLITDRFPSHGLVGEEFGSTASNSEFVWVLDPIDGTKAFTTGCPLFGTLIALLHEGQPVLGAICQPILNQLIIGDGHTTTLNGVQVHARTTASLDTATLLLTDRRDVVRYQDEARFKVLESRARIVRTWGDCYGYLLLSSGFADIMLDPIMNPWDLLPLVPIVRGAGGIITDWQGRDPVKATSIVAATAPLHRQVLAVLNGVP